MTAGARNLARLVGAVVSAIALGIFIYLFADALAGTDLRRLAAREWMLLPLAMAIYGLAYVPMTAAWVGLARASGAKASRGALAHTLLVSQIGKYLPGNFAHFLGRAYLARGYGVPLASSGQAIALELAGVLAAGGILAGAAVALGAVGSAAGHAVFWLSGLAGAAALIGSAWVLRGKSSTARALLGPLLTATALYGLVLALLAVCNVLLVVGLGAEASMALAGKVAGAFLVSWLIGFVTPGSPAGLGLRELTFVGLLGGSLPPETLVLSATLFRVATIAGDLVAWLAGIVLPVKAQLDVPEPIPL